MATVTIPMSRGGTRISMPRMCIVCGGTPCRQKKTQFHARFSGGWFGRSGTRLLMTSVPLCLAHDDHFDGLHRQGCIVSVIVLASILGGGVLMAAFKLFWAIPVAIGIVLITALVHVILMGIAYQTLVHATAISDRSVTLANVHPSFARAVTGDDGGDEYGDYEEDDRPRRRDDEEDEYDRPRRRGRREEEDEAPRQSHLWLWLVLGGMGLLVLVVVVVTLVLLRSMNLGGPPPQPGPGPGDEPAPLAIDPGWDEKAMRRDFLSDMQEHGVSVGWGTFGKNGLLGFDHKGVPVEKNIILFEGRPSPKGLSLHPPERGTARARYRLGGAYKLLTGRAAKADLPADAWAHGAPSVVTFSIVGDGKLLWRSRPLQNRGDADTFRLSVAGVQELELRTTCRDKFDYAWAVWLDPAVHR